jgi:hypothetical protein
MQALLSLEEAPPISAPVRFFLTAPLFAIAAGALLLWSGPALFASRWTPAALALTHLITAGFMLQVMLGALLQLLPVVAGANIGQPRRVATLVHATITLGTVCLVGAFLGFEPWLFRAAVFLMGTGVLTFIGAAGHALLGVPGSTPIVRGLRLALLGLCIAVGLGLWLAASLGWSLEVALAQWANIHLGWGLAGWGTVLLASVGFVVVPMFQQTPNYPGWFERHFAYATLGTVLLWSIAEGADWERLASVLSVGVVLLAASFAVTTFWLQRQRKPAKLNAVQRLWQLAMLSTLAACALWLLVRIWPLLDQWQGWPLLFGALLLCGGFMSVMVGMLYKIVPFLVWLHLQERGQGRLKAPNMKKVLAETPMDRQVLAHFVALGLLLLAVVWPQWLTYPAGLALMLANGWLLKNLLSAMTVYRRHLAQIEALEARQTPA